MRYPILSVLAAALLLSLPDAVSAQDDEDLRPKKPQKTRIEKVRYGFVGGGVTRQTASAFGEFKSGAWMPIYVDVLVGSEDLPNGRIVIEGTDCDDVKNTYTVPLLPLKKGEQTQVMGYTKPSALDTEITITLYDGRDKLVERKESPNALDPGNVLFLAVGGRLQGLVRALAPLDQQVNEDDPLVDGNRTQGRYVGYLDDVRQLPSRWFGYEGADVVILLTGDRNFVEGLLNDREVNKDVSRYAALAEWVRRGGRLVVCVGRNQDVVRALDDRQPLLPVRPVGTNAEPEVGWLRSLAPNEPLSTSGIPFARFEPKAGQEYHLDQARDLKNALVIRGRHGLGQVMVIAFDAEQSAFARWKGQTDFWRWFLGHSFTPRVPPRAMQGQGQVVFPGGQRDDYNELASQLQQALENFEDVPVISFGWVALFIVIYILIVGPLDYFFLKKVVKRLELTWITFPVVVLVISAAAYFTAYYVKGNDQRINKVDLVDIDLAGKQAHVYGQSWFTIFSPRIQHYVIGLEPSADGWAPRDKTNVLLSWMGRPDSSSMGYRRTRSQSLFRRSYEFEPDGSGMKNVPIQVWSTKSFVANWATTEPAATPFEAEVVATANNQLTGRIVNRLPVTLDVVIVRNIGTGGVNEVRVYPLGTLPPGGQRALDNVFKDTAHPSAWLNEQWAGKPLLNLDESDRPSAHRSPHSPTAGLVTQFLFHGLLKGVQGSERHNSTVRHLDQSWRLAGGKELILYGRTGRLEKRAEDVTSDPRSPSRLWLGQLPGAGAARPAVNGMMSQETFVRVFIPIRSASE